MSVIYEPSGKAREYAPLACNIYNGCNHGCLYCYAPAIKRMRREDYHDVGLRRNILSDFSKDCKKHYGTSKNMLFCFMTDPYNALEKELRITREFLKIALKHKIPVSILTKSKEVLNDIDVIKKFGPHIKIGMTLTFDNEKDSKQWEPEASLPNERIETLRSLKEKNITTWASFEPVIDPKQSISMIKKSLQFVDMYKVGKLNNYKGIDKSIDWADFLHQSIDILRNEGKQFYIKKDLRVSAPSVRLYGNEVTHDDLSVPSFVEISEVSE